MVQSPSLYTCRSTQISNLEQVIQALTEVLPGYNFVASDKANTYAVFSNIKQEIGSITYVPTGSGVIIHDTDTLGEHGALLALHILRIFNATVISNTIEKTETELMELTGIRNKEEIKQDNSSLIKGMIIFTIIALAQLVFLFI